MQNEQEKHLGGVSPTEADAASVLSASTVAPHAVPTHTPGPWSIEEIHENEILISSAATPADGEWTLASVWRDCQYLQSTAPHNANLIAAAPEMYAVLVKMLIALWGPRECTHGMEGDEDMCDGCAFQREKAVGLVATEMRAVIAKAEGRS